MIKILHFGRSCKTYLRIYEKRSPDVSLSCEDCGCHLHKHGRYYRSVTTKRDMIRIPVYRLYCPDCGATVSLLPDFLVPWARFATWVREAATHQREEGVTWQQIAKSTTMPLVRVSRSTLKRWWRRSMRAAASAAMWVAGELVSLGAQEDLLGMYPAKMVQHPQDTLSWFRKLLLLYSPVKPWRRGYWTFLNTRLPEAARL